MAETVFILSAAISCFCTFALAAGYRKSGNKLLLWSALCFFFLAMNSIFVCVDMIVFPDINFQGPFWRNILSATAGGLLLSGLIWEAS